MYTNDEIQRMVNEALDCAVFENEYVQLMDYTSSELADDLVMYDPRFEGLAPSAIQVQVMDYIRWYHADKTKAQSVPRSV